MKDRIKLIMESLRLTQQSFAQAIGLSTPTICNILNGKTRASLTVIEAIKTKFPQVNTEWLLFGTGDMYKKDGMDESLTASSESVSESCPSAGTQPSLLSDVDKKEPEELDFFDQPNVKSVQPVAKNMAQTEIKYIDKPQRKITEIRIFYDDQTWETFVPKK